MTDDRRTPAQVYAMVFGALLLLAGILGFFADASFGGLGGDVEGDKLIVFEVNGWHNLVHIASGALGLALMGTPAGARAYALGFGAVYVVVSIWGLAVGHIAGLLPINTADNLLHIAIAATGIAAGLLSSPGRATGGSRSATAP